MTPPGYEAPPHFVKVVLFRDFFFDYLAKSDIVDTTAIVNSNTFWQTKEDKKKTSIVILVSIYTKPASLGSKCFTMLK